TPDPTTAISRNAVPIASIAARRPTASLPAIDWFNSSNESAEEFAINLIGIQLDRKLPGKKLARIFGAIDSRRLDLNLLESRTGQLRLVLALIERAGNASHPGQYTLADLGQNFSARDHIRHCKPPARLEDAECFAQRPIFVGRKIDDAV